MADRPPRWTDNETGKSYEMPIIHGTIGPRLVDIRKFYGDPGCSPTIPGFTSTGSCGSKITYIDGDEGVLLYRGYNIAELAEQSDFMEVLLPADEGRAAEQGAEGKVRQRTSPYHTMVHEQLSQFYRGFRRDAHPMAVMLRRGRRAVGLLSRLARHPRSAPAHDRLATGWSPRCRRSPRWPTSIRSASRSSIRATTSPTPANFLRMMFCGAGRGIRGQPGRREGDGPHPDAPRRPRAERLDLDRAPRRLVRRQPVRLHRRRHRLAVGPEPRRRQRSRASTC